MKNSTKWKTVKFRKTHISDLANDDFADGWITESEILDFYDLVNKIQLSNDEIRYFDYLGEKYCQAYTLKEFGSLDDYTDISCSFKAGMKKQSEVTKKLLDGVKIIDLLKEL